jgi:hypothetical protein
VTNVDREPVIVAEMAHGVFVEVLEELVSRGFVAGLSGPVGKGEPGLQGR